MTSWRDCEPEREVVEEKQDKLLILCGGNREWCAALRRWRWQVVRAMARKLVVPMKAVWLSAKPDDLLRLMNWKVWTRRYNVSLEFILDTIFLHYNRKVRRGKKYVSVGVPVSLLTGEKAREVIEQALSRLYTEQENVAAAKSDLRLKILGTTKVSTESSMAEYARIMQHRREATVQAAALYKRRAWRGNPWL